MIIAGTIIFSIAWLLVFTGMRDAMGPINRRLKKAKRMQHRHSLNDNRSTGNGPRDIAFCPGVNLQTQ